MGPGDMMGMGMGLGMGMGMPGDGMMGMGFEMPGACPSQHNTQRPLIARLRSIF